MKKQISLIILSLASALLLASCGSGSSQSNNSTNLLGGNQSQETYSGSILFTSGQAGEASLNLQVNGSIVQGNIIYKNGYCLCNALITGNRVGFDMNLESGECSAQYRPEVCDSNDLDGDSGLCKIETATGQASYLLSGTDENLTGTFTVSGDICQNAYRQSNAGKIVFKRQ